MDYSRYLIQQDRCCPAAPAGFCTVTIPSFLQIHNQLCGSTVATFITKRLVKEGKFDMEHLQNSTLAGGVAVGAANVKVVEQFSKLKCMTPESQHVHRDSFAIHVRQRSDQDDIDSPCTSRRGGPTRQIR